MQSGCDQNENFEVSMLTDNKPSRHDMEMDRLSSLPPEIIHHMLSLMDTKYAIQTCVLSTKWTHHWTHIQSLYFDYLSFRRLDDFKQFVYHVIYHFMPTSLFRVRFHGTNDTHLAETVMCYANALRVEELEIRIFMMELHRPDMYHVKETPAYLFGCQTLKTLKLDYFNLRVPRKAFRFESLTTLELSSCLFYAENDGYDFFSGCLSLQNLSLINCHFFGNIFEISAPNLVYLVVSNLSYNSEEIVKELVMSTPTLKFLDIKGNFPLFLRIDKFSSPENVNIFMVSSLLTLTRDDMRQSLISRLINMAKGFPHAKSLVITLNIEEVMNIFLRRKSPFEEPEIVEEMITESGNHLDESPWKSMLLGLLDSD